MNWIHNKVVNHRHHLSGVKTQLKQGLKIFREQGLLRLISNRSEKYSKEKTVVFAFRNFTSVLDEEYRTFEECIP